MSQARVSTSGCVRRLDKMIRADRVTVSPLSHFFKHRHPAGSAAVESGPQLFCGGGGAAHEHVLLSMFLSLIVNDRAGENVCAAALPCLNA